MTPRMLDSVAQERVAEERPGQSVFKKRLTAVQPFRISSRKECNHLSVCLHVSDTMIKIPERQSPQPRRRGQSCRKPVREPTGTTNEVGQRQYMPRVYVHGQILRDCNSFGIFWDSFVFVVFADLNILTHQK